MEQSWYKIFNYGSIGIVFVLALLLAIDMFRGTFDLIPKSLYLPLLIFVGVLFILRIGIRIYLVKYYKK